jgi:hypothetical protein
MPPEVVDLPFNHPDLEVDVILLPFHPANSTLKGGDIVAKALSLGVRVHFETLESKVL